MASRLSGDRRLDASGSREVVFCHQCDNEWYNDEHGLICPRCESEITEIVSLESDPRPERNPSSTPLELRSLDNHYPWSEENETSDPEEADIEEHIRHGPGGSIFIAHSLRSNLLPDASQSTNRPSGIRRDSNEVMRDFQNMVGSIMGPGFRPGPAGRSDTGNLFPGTFTHIQGPGYVGRRFTYASASMSTRGTNDAGPADLAAIIGNILGGFSAAQGAEENEPHGEMPRAVQGLFASLMNPANARSGDAVYTQEALDQIISNLMEQHPTSNAPGPASPDAIANLPKTKLDEALLGADGKGECSVCMDDVHIGDEVVMLPCKHWFHEACASAWLSEHNTCPICRKGIEDEPGGASSSSRYNPRTRHRSETEHTHMARQRTHSGDSTTLRNATRLESIRRAGQVTPNEEPHTMRRQRTRDGTAESDSANPVPGSFPSTRRRHSEMSANNGPWAMRRGTTSGSDRSRDSQQSSGSSATNSRNNRNSGPIAWIRERFSGNSDRH